VIVGRSEFPSDEARSSDVALAEFPLLRSEKGGDSSMAKKKAAKKKKK